MQCENNEQIKNTEMYMCECLRRFHKNLKIHSISQPALELKMFFTSSKRFLKMMLRSRETTLEHSIIAYWFYFERNIVFGR